MVTDKLLNLITSVVVSGLVSLVVAWWRTTRTRQHQRDDVIEDWYSRTLSLCTLLLWEINRINDDVSIDDRRDAVAFGELQASDGSVPEELQFVDELVYDLFKHAGNAPYEIQPAGSYDPSEPLTDDVIEFVESYLNPDIKPTNTEPKVSDFRSEWIEQLDKISESCRSELTRLDGGPVDGIFNLGILSFMLCY